MESANLGCAPFQEERTRFLNHMLNSGWSKKIVRVYELRLVEFASRVEIWTPGGVTALQIEQAAESWLKASKRVLRSKDSREGLRVTFIRAAMHWLRFLGLLCEPEPKPHSTLISAFQTFLDEERGLSSRSIETKSWHTERFLMWLDREQLALDKVSINEVELYLNSKPVQAWSRVTVSICVQSLRSFFRYALKTTLCSKNIAEGIGSPRVYRHAGLPKGPSWPQVRCLISSIGNAKPLDIRDRAIIILLANYGFRCGELVSMRLKDINWEREQIVISRRKQHGEQLYPLGREAGDAIVLYLTKARPQNNHHELFLSQRPPHAPLTRNGIGTAVQRRMRSLGEKLPRYGPHSLRHACATRLVSEEFTLKEISDQLGHRDSRSTQVYAKVDLKGLKEVGRLDLGGLV